MKKAVKFMVPMLGLLALTGCVSTSSSQDGTSSIVNPTSSVTSTGETVADGISFTDNIGSYTVGETFNSIFDLTVSIHYSDGTTRDVSAKPAYYKTIVKNSSGETVDTSKPFESAGTYSMQVYYKSNSAIVSEAKNFTVSAVLTNTVSTKTDATASFNYCDVENSSLSNLSFPTSGNVNTLVLPIEISDYPFSRTGHGTKYREALDATFNGDGATDTGYWESVSSYYKKSSMGKLNFDFTIAETYESGMTASDVNDLGNESTASLTMIENALANYTSIHGAGSLKKYDNDGDGYIDGLWAVYSAPDYSSNSTIGALSNKGIFWAFCTDTTKNQPNVDNPTLHSYGWASQTFMNEAVAASDGVDAHTFIHETGHLLSLPDYYSYDISSSSSSGCQGGLAMMDLNIGDQDAFSKMALGWADPYVVTEDCVITINPNESTGDCILLAENWNGTAFDEYMLFDLQTPTGLNSLDSSKAYNSRPLYYNKAGVRAYHVDARLGELMHLYKGELDVTKESTYWVTDDEDDYYVSDDDVKALNAQGSLPRLSTDKSVSVDTRTPGYSVINANCASRASISQEPYTKNRLLTLVTRDNVNCETDLKYGSADSLFQAGDSWDLARKGGKYFTTNAMHFNNGDDLNWVVTVLSVSDTSATLQFRKY